MCTEGTNPDACGICGAISRPHDACAAPWVTHRLPRPDARRGGAARNAPRLGTRRAGRRGSRAGSAWRAAEGAQDMRSAAQRTGRCTARHRSAPCGRRAAAIGPARHSVQSRSCSPPAGERPGAAPGRRARRPARSRGARAGWPARVTGRQMVDAARRHRDLPPAPGAKGGWDGGGRPGDHAAPGVGARLVRHRSLLVALVRAAQQGAREAVAAVPYTPHHCGISFWGTGKPRTCWSGGSPAPGGRTPGARRAPGARGLGCRPRRPAPIEVSRA